MKAHAMRPLPVTLGLAAALATTLTTPAWAAAAAPHPLIAAFLQGLVRPIAADDQLLVLAAMGLWAGFALPRRAWAGAGLFLTAMVAGMMLSMAGISLPMAETWITLSAMVFAILVIAAWNGQRRGVLPGMLIAIAGFGLFDLHLDAAALTAPAAPLALIAGFLTTATAMMALAIAIARAAATSAAIAPVVARLSEGVITAAGGSRLSS